MSRLGIVRHPIYQEHDAGYGHPESPDRLAVLEPMLASEAKGMFVDIEPRQASREEICWVHSSAYYDQVAATASRSHTMLDMDTHTSPRSYEAALMAAGGLLNLVQALHDGEIEAGFALVRPPGHHAERDRAMGFCLFNNIAIAASYAINKLGLERILIVDWDVHHGNGTQHSFEEDRRVLYFSAHQSPFYPGTGAVGEVGRGEGEGYTVNVPVSYDHGDKEYVQIFSRILGPIGRAFNPQFILVSAGFDTYYQDLLGSQNVMPQGYAAMSRFLDELAADCCPGRLALTLEGGYNVEGQRDSILAIIKQLSLTEPLGDDELRDDPDRPDIEAVASAREIQSRYWPGL